MQVGLIIYNNISNNTISSIIPLNQNTTQNLIENNQLMIENCCKIFSNAILNK